MKFTNVSSLFKEGGAGPRNVTTVLSGLDKLRQPYAGSLKVPRLGFVLTSNYWAEQGNALVLHAGPSEAQWSVGLRASSEDTKGGRAHYAQYRPAGSGRTYFNLPTVAFTFQTGNTLPIPTISLGNSRAGVPYGLQDFYHFMDLINQDPIIPDGVREGDHNYLWVFYTSLQFPQLVLKGYIEPEGVSWSDSAENPNGFTWSATMAVYDSAPNIWDAPNLLNDYGGFDFALF